MGDEFWMGLGLGILIGGAVVRFDCYVMSWWKEQQKR
jgi:hypothetical protein